MKSKIRALNSMKIAMFSVLNSWFGLICSMLLLNLFKNYTTLIVRSLFLHYFLFIYVNRGGRFSDGWGSCERREKRFLKPNHDIPSTAETRAKNKACQVGVFF